MDSSSKFLGRIEDILSKVDGAESISELIQDRSEFFWDLEAVIKRLLRDNNLEGLILCIDLLYKSFFLLNDEKLSCLGKVIDSVIMCLDFEGLRDLTESFLGLLLEDQSTSRLLKSVLHSFIKDTKHNLSLRRIACEFYNNGFHESMTMPLSPRPGSNPASPWGGNMGIKTFASTPRSAGGPSSATPRSNIGIAFSFKESVPQNAEDSSPTPVVMPKVGKPVGGNEVRREKDNDSGGRDMLESPRMSPRDMLGISFLPQYLVKRWMNYSCGDELTSCLAEVLGRVSAMDSDAKARLKANTKEIDVLINVLLGNLSISSGEVQSYTLQILDKLLAEFPDSFLNKFELLFHRLQAMQNDEKMNGSGLNHAMKLCKSLSARLPFPTTSSEVFACLEKCKGSLKTHVIVRSLQMASLSLLTIIPSSKDPFILRFTETAAAMLEPPAASTPSNTSFSPRGAGGNMREAVLDVLAAAYLVFEPKSETDRTSFREGGHKDTDKYMEDFFRQFNVEVDAGSQKEIRGRAQALRFPSLGSDSDTALLLNHLTSRRNNAMNNTYGSFRFSACSPDGGRPISINDFGRLEPFSPWPTVTSSSKLRNTSSQSTAPVGLDVCIDLDAVPFSATDGQRTNAGTSLSSASTFQPTWTSPDSGSITPGSPWPFRPDSSAQPESRGPSTDPSKLSSIKRLKKLYSNGKNVFDDEDAFRVQGGSKSALGLRNSAGDVMPECVTPSPMGPHTPMEVGLYGENGTRSQRLRRSVRHRSAGVAYRMSDASGASTPLGTPLDNCTHNEWIKDSPVEDAVKHKRADGSEREHVKNVSFAGGAPEEIPDNPRYEDKAFSLFEKSGHDSPAVYAAPSVDDQDDSPDSSVKLIANADSLGTLPSISEGSRDVSSEKRSKFRGKNRTKGRVALATHIADIEVDDGGSVSGLLNKPAYNPVTDAFEYVPSDQLSPFDDPAEEVTNVLVGLENGQWPDIFHTLTAVRRLGLHHKSAIKETGALHGIIKGTLTQVDNLRSAVSKNALLALGDMFSGLGKDMDLETGVIVPRLLKKATDSSIFLSESADMALQNMITYSSTTRSLVVLLASADHRHASIRAKVAVFLLRVVQAKAADLRACRELPNFITKLGKLVSDQAPEARAAAREAIRMVITSKIMSRSDVEKYITPDVVEKCMQVNLNATAAGLPGIFGLGGSALSVNKAPSSTSPRTVSSGKGGGSKPARNRLLGDLEHESNEKKPPARRPAKAPVAAATASPAAAEDDLVSVGIAGQHLNAFQKQGTSSSPSSNSSTPYAISKTDQKRALESAEMQALPELVTSLSTKSWLERKSAVGNLTDFICSNWQLMRTAGKLDSTMEMLLTRMEDGSIKVAVQAITGLSKIHDAAPTILPSMVLIAMPFLLGAVSATNRDVSSIANTLLWSIVGLCPMQTFLTQLSAIALHEREKLKATAFRVMGTYVSRNLVGQKDVVKRYVFPAVCQTVCGLGVRPEVKSAAIEVLRNLQASYRDRIWQWAETSNAQDELKRILT